MSTFDYFLCAWLLLGTTLVVASVGKPRKALEPTTAAITLLVNLGVVVWLLTSRGVFA